MMAATVQYNWSPMPCLLRDLLVKLHCSSQNQKGMHKTKKALHQRNTISTDLAKRDPTKQSLH